MSSVAPVTVTKEMLQTFLSGKTFLSRATSGMWGVFHPNGTIDIYSGREYDPAHPNQGAVKQAVAWKLSDSELIMKFSEKTTLNWPLQSMKFIEKNGQTILSFDGNCVNIVGNSSVKEGQSPGDLDVSIKAGSCL
jgi:hypothetical protein